VIFNGELFESPNYCSTLRQAEDAAAEVALNILSRRSSFQSLAARFFDATGSAKTCCRRQLKGLVCHYLQYFLIWTWASACLHMLGGGSRHDFLRRGCQNQEASREKCCHGSLVSSEAICELDHHTTIGSRSE